jgi:hypothetical protein
MAVQRGPNGLYAYVIDNQSKERHSLRGGSYRRRSGLVSVLFELSNDALTLVVLLLSLAIPNFVRNGPGARSHSKRTGRRGPFGS